MQTEGWEITEQIEKHIDSVWNGSRISGATTYIRIQNSTKFVNLSVYGFVLPSSQRYVSVHLLAYFQQLLKVHTIW